ncbi:hypothetical protein SUGI_0232690 [Cryptomeria japonica]|uniref:protein neprosin n=1 Tax=Cryptomeria japonica TaxID=3369 RepID=UPI002408EFDD|nr:protein neprosin [Cryptomeria japonica]GLJ14404.1 hypothetical protein SUGI_0232690 [Cryptomeria japonica]
MKLSATRTMFHHHTMETNLGRASSKRMSWMWNDLILVLVFVTVFGVEANLVVESSQFDDRSSNIGNNNSTKMLKVLKHLRKINKPSIKSIQSSNGDIIDCIDRHKQIAFDHPFLKNHKIQDPPKMPSIHIARVNTTNFTIDNAQSWHVNGDCPEGTIPVRRTSIEDLMREKSHQHYGKKIALLPPNEYAVASVDGNYYGAEATINIWAPKVENNEFSSSQIWVVSGSFQNPGLNAIEAGWLVDPSLYGDSNPRLFTYWTADSYKKTGCYNLLCSGFVQYSKKIAVGAAIRPISQYSGKQFEITITLWKDQQSKNWWMAFQDEYVGYWPSQIFTNLDHATHMEWGGQILNSKPNGQHTTTEMGSGHFAKEGSRKSSYFRALRTVDDKNAYRDAINFTTFTSNTNCYSIERSRNSNNFFYYGGPGRSPNCR